MTFNKIVYIGCEDLCDLEEDLHDAGLTDQVSNHIDGANEGEVWVEVDNDFALDILAEHRFISQNEKTEIIENGVDTVLFY